MNLPDETALKDEIKEISDKIDAIIHTVNKIYPMDTDTFQEHSEAEDPQDS